MSAFKPLKRENKCAPHLTECVIIYPCGAYVNASEKGASYIQFLLSLTWLSLCL